MEKKNIRNVLCRYGSHCTKKKTCPFIHPAQILCRNGKSCTRSLCKFVHLVPVPCKFGDKCNRKESNTCCFSHDPCIKKSESFEGDEFVSQDEIVCDPIGTFKSAVNNEQYFTVEFMILPGSKFDINFDNGWAIKTAFTKKDYTLASLLKYYGCDLSFLGQNFEQKEIMDFLSKIDDYHPL